MTARRCVVVALVAAWVATGAALEWTYGAGRWVAFGVTLSATVAVGWWWEEMT